MPLLFRSKKDIARDHARKREREIARQIAKECQYYTKLIPDVLANCGIDHWKPRPDRPTNLESMVTGAQSRQKIRILETRWNEYAIYLWIDSRQLPYRTELPDLHTDGVMETLSDACGRQVVWRSAPGRGSWFIVWRDGAINAIPEKFPYSAATAMIPKNAGPLYFIAGVGENNALTKGNLADSMMPHYLVAGATGAGKSVHLNGVICQFIERNTPATLQMIMIDLKGGTEFAFYENLPHLVMPVIKRPEGVMDALQYFYDEMERRSELFAASGVKNIEGYNDKYPGDKLPYLLLIFDEIALILRGPDRKLAGMVEDLLSSILARSRSSGGHCILCTQSPNGKVVSPFIKINCPTRICFSVPSNSDSMVVIDRGLAAGLEPAGRAIFSSGPYLTEIQSPYISDNEIREIVRSAIERGGGVAPKTADMVTWDDILDEAINNYSGKLHRDRLYKSFAGRISRDRIGQMIDAAVGHVVNFRGRRYEIVDKGKGIHGGRVLMPLDPAGDDSEAFSDQPRLQLIVSHIKPQSPHSILKAKPNADARKVS